MCVSKVRPKIDDCRTDRSKTHSCCFVGRPYTDEGFEHRFIVTRSPSLDGVNKGGSGIKEKTKYKFQKKHNDIVINSENAVRAKFFFFPGSRRVFTQWYLYYYSISYDLVLKNRLKRVVTIIVTFSNWNENLITVKIKKKIIKFGFFQLDKNIILLSERTLDLLDARSNQIIRRRRSNNNNYYFVRSEVWIYNN